MHLIAGQLIGTSEVLLRNPGEDGPMVGSRHRFQTVLTKASFPLKRRAVSLCSNDFKSCLGGRPSMFCQTPEARGYSRLLGAAFVTGCVLSSDTQGLYADESVHPGSSLMLVSIAGWEIGLPAPPAE